MCGCERQVSPEDIYLEVGKGLFDCQCYELSLAFLLHLVSAAEHSDLDPDKTLRTLMNEKKSRKTLGQMKDVLKRRTKIPLSKDTIDIVEEGCAKRNRLAHRVLIESAPQMVTDEGRRAVMAEIKDLRKWIRKAEECLNPMIDMLAALVLGNDIRTMAAMNDDERLLYMRRYVKARAHARSCDEAG